MHDEDLMRAVYLILFIPIALVAIIVELIKDKRGK